MKSFLPLLSTVIVFASCSTAYKSGQTPDDVYFSPVRPQQEYVRVEEKDEDRTYRRTEDDYYRNDDRYLRMKIRDRDRWAYLDEYYRDPYAYNYNSKYYYNQCGYSNPRSYWNSNYNPYGGQIIIVNSRTPIKNTPRTYNLHVFDSPSNNNTNSKTSGSKSRTYSNSNDRSNSQPANTGSDLRTIFRGSENTGNSSKPQSTQSSSNSSNSNSNSNSNSTNSSSGSAAPKRKS